MTYPWHDIPARNPYCLASTGFCHNLALQFLECGQFLGFILLEGFEFCLMDFLLFSFLLGSLDLVLQQVDLCESFDFPLPFFFDDGLDFFCFAVFASNGLFPGLFQRGFRRFPPL